MRLQVKIALVTGVFALGVCSVALAAGKPEATGKPEGVPRGQGAAHAHEGSGPTYVPGEPGPKEGLPPQAKAYGRYCKGESREHVKGEKGTAFSRCVKDVVTLRHQKKQEERRAA